MYLVEYSGSKLWRMCMVVGYLIDCKRFGLAIGKIRLCYQYCSNVVIVVCILLASWQIVLRSVGEQFNGFTCFKSLCDRHLWLSHDFGTLDAQHIRGCVICLKYGYTSTSRYIMAHTIIFPSFLDDERFNLAMWTYTFKRLGRYGG